MWLGRRLGGVVVKGAGRMRRGRIEAIHCTRADVFNARHRYNDVVKDYKKSEI